MLIPMSHVKVYLAVGAADTRWSYYGARFSLRSSAFGLSS
jgi:hypothetical protein